MKRMRYLVEGLAGGNEPALTGPKTVQELAGWLEWNPDALRRLLRQAEGMGLVRRVGRRMVKRAGQPAVLWEAA